MEWSDEMKRNGETMLLLLFCGGIIVGLLLPRWTFINLYPEAGFLALDSLRQYTAAQINYGVVLKKVMASRFSLMFLLYFSCYCAAGFWILAGSCLAIGVSMGFFGAMAVIRMRYWGIFFWCCTLMPQWLFYGWAGRKMVQFMENRRNRTLFCSGNPVPAYNKKVFLAFLSILTLTCMGVFSEVYLNTGILKYFLKIYITKG